MDIIYLGHSCFKLKGKSASLITDPFDPKLVGFPLAKVDCDIVSISHSHPDHNFLDRISGYKFVVDRVGEYEISDVSILGIPAYHDTEKGDKRGKNVIFVFEIDGLRLVHLGDLGHKLDDETLTAIGDIDVAFVPCGGEYTIGPEIAAEVVRGIEPVVTIPMHFKEAGLSPELASKLLPVDDFLKDVGLTVEKTDKLTLKSDINREDRKIVLLERR